jgi:glycosyltransferase involved in cell wall biosynthesis
MRLLFITQKLHGQDAFTVLWVRAFMRQGFQVTVLCLESTEETYEFPVISLGKERGSSRLRSLLEFERRILSLPYDRVFIHMTPVWYVFGCWWWMLRGTPTYLWYTHYKMQLGVRLFGWFGKRFFCATEQSLPQYMHSEKKLVVGHGIDMEHWRQIPNVASDPTRLLVVHRLSRSKRLELIIGALPLLPEAYSLDVYGIEAEQDYVAELHALVQKLHLQSRVRFHGTVPMQKLHAIYPTYRLILNMASETIDKTMLEAMTCGCYPVTTAANARAIGIPAAPVQDTSAAIAAFVREHIDRLPLTADGMFAVVERSHSLAGLAKKMAEYIRPGR